MRHFKALGAALVAMFALGITTTSALALPDIGIALGGSYPIHLNFPDDGKTAWIYANTAGNQFSGKGRLRLELYAALGSLGTFQADLLHCTDGFVECNSPGDAKGVVLLKGTVHLVLTPAPAARLATLTSLEEVKLEAGKQKISLRGAVLSRLNAGEGEITSVKEGLTGAKGKNELTEYVNDEGKAVKAVLETNFGTGFLQTDEAVEGESELMALESKMFEITSR